MINVVERAVIMSERPELRLLDKLDGIAPEHPLEEPPKLSPGGERIEIKALFEVEREHILRTLQQTEWKVEGREGAAQLLQMNPSTLRARIRKLGIKRIPQRRNVFSNLKPPA